MTKSSILLVVLLAPLMCLPIQAASEDPGPPSEIGIYQPFQITSNGTMDVHIYVYNRTDLAQAYQGDVADENGNLILTGNWDMILEEIKGGKVISSRSMRMGKQHKGAHHLLEPQSHYNWEWKASVADLTDHPGNYRFQVKYGELTKRGQLFRIVRSLKTPEYIEVRYVTDKENYFIGEPITVSFIVTNNGQDDFLFETGGDYRGATRHLRFYFTATNELGQKAIDPKPNQSCFGGLGGRIDLKPGEEHKIELPLLAYLSFPVPGTYMVKGYQALGFGEPANVLGKEDKYGLGWQHSYGGSFKVVIRNPSKAEILNLIKSQLSIPDRYERSQGMSLLHDTMYLKPLLKVLDEESDEEQIEALLAGIGSILTVESTQHLIKLATDHRVPVRVYALQNLFRRMPPKQIQGQSAQDKIPDWKRHEIETAWDESLRSLLPDILRKGLESESLDEISVTANCVALLGDPEMMPLLAKAADRIAPQVPVSEKISRIVNQLAGAVYTLHDYGHQPIEADENSSPGRLAVWANSVLRRKEYHTERWGNLLLHMMNMDCALTQYNAIRWLPEDFNKREQVPWKKLLSAKEHQVWWYALQAARSNFPPDLETIATEILKKTNDQSKQQDLRDLLKELNQHKNEKMGDV